jgi:hypothetical protein
MPPAVRYACSRFKLAPILVIFVLCGFVAPRPVAAAELRLLSYNVRGVPPVISFLGRPGTRIPLIVEKLDAYDVALLQETFSYQDVIERCAVENDCAYYHGPERQFRWGHVIAAPVLGLCWLTPRCRLPANSGLMTIAQPDRVASERILAKRYKRCWGYLIGGSDCLSAKGYVLVRITLDDGTSVDVYNTHLDAANWRWDRSTRKSQFKELTRAIEEHSRGRAVIVAGDFNSRHRQDRIERFRNSSNLEDSTACRQSPEGGKRKLDRIFFRSGEGIQLACLHTGNDPTFTYQRGGVERSLSDHRALIATFDISRVSGRGADGPGGLE